MKLVSISCIKNEADIIEAFVRVNASFVDTFLFVDDSDDGTGEILNRLAGEGYRIFRFLRPNKSETFQQDRLVLSALRSALDQNLEGDYFFLLDSDEFPKFTNRDHAFRVLTEIPPNHIGVFQWETYVPNVLDFDKIISNGLTAAFRRRLPEGPLFEKVVIPRSLARDVYVSIGSHAASRIDGQPLSKYLLSEKLAHFPVRSAAQIIKKNISTAYSLMRKENRLLGEGGHVFECLKQLMGCGFELPIEALQKIAIDYANSPGANAHLGEAPGWIQPYELSYTDLANANLVESLCKILVASWTSPFLPAQTFELARVLSSKRH